MNINSLTKSSKHIQKNEIRNIGLKRNYFNIVIAIYDKLTASIFVTKKSLVLFYWIQECDRISTISILFNNWNHDVRKETKGTYIERKEIKVFLLAYHMNWYMKYPKSSTRKCSVMLVMSAFSNVVGYRMNFNNQ